ncbi:MAG: glycine/betaine/sarcosine/D-proline family reductase selenoprotein B [Burkholderiales bacterium]|nr:glycine/betaine/sarcosine/D-proline family reductase selenoprotein B [Burkholderiales bacterium]
MQAPVVRVVHYLNQFFGGIGGEDKADVAPTMRAGPTGPGKALQAALGGRGEVVATVICGDNCFAEKPEEACAEVLRLVESCRPDVLVAGPAFDAGRYGIACGAVCRAAEKRLGIPAVTGMYDENPGVELHARQAYIVRTGETVAAMAAAIGRMVNLALRLAAGGDPGGPSEAGYFPRGVLVNVMAEKTGAERVVEMLLAKLRGDHYESEVTLPHYDRVAPARAIADMKSATIALVTDGGLVPKGNPDRVENRHATRWGAYGVDLVDPAGREGYEVVHGGYDPVFVHEDPNRLLPVDVMRELEKEGVIGRLHPRFYSTSGLASVVKNSEQMGREMAERLRAEGVSGAILTST